LVGFARGIVFNENENWARIKTLEFYADSK